MAEEIVYHIGARVRCKDGPCGRLRNVVVDPATRRVTDLVVEKGLLLTMDRVLPAHAVEEIDEKQITLDIGRDALNDYPEYRDVAFEPVTPDLEGDQYSADEALVWASTWDPYYMLPAVPLIRRHIHEGLAEEAVAIGRGTPVRNDKGRIGEVDHVLVNPDSGRITFIVVDPGPAQYSMVVPISMVGSVAEDGVSVNATNEELGQLHHYACPSDSDLLADLRASLAELAADLGGIELAVERGVARLAGTVPDAETKRQVEAAVRTNPSVIHVENAVSTDAAIRALVIAALAADARTDIAVVDVESDRAVVTLTGTVDSEEIREAVEEVACEQQGVISVVNGLEVSPDELSQVLSLRSVILPTEGGSGIGSG